MDGVKEGLDGDGGCRNDGILTFGVVAQVPGRPVRVRVVVVDFYEAVAVRTVPETWDR